MHVVVFGFTHLNERSRNFLVMECHALPELSSLIALLLRAGTLNPRRNLLRRQSCRRIIRELIHQRGHSRENASLLLVFHEPLHELRVRGLALRRGS